MQELGTQRKITDLRNEILQAYHVSLIVDEVIEIKGSPYGFCQDFVKWTNLSAGAMKLRENLTLLQIKENNWQPWIFNLNNTFGKKKHSTVVDPLPTTETDVQIDGFLDKLVFVVNSRNATEMEQEVLPADFREYYYEENCLVQATRVLKYITKWINKKDCSWLTTTDGKVRV